MKQFQVKINVFLCILIHHLATLKKNELYVSMNAISVCINVESSKLFKYPILINM